MLQNLETALAGGLGQMSLVKWLPDVSTQTRVFISGNEIQGIVTYIPVGGGAGEMAVGGKLKSVGGHVGLYHQRCMLESWHIRSELNTMNRDEGNLPPFYDLLIRQSHSPD